MVSSYSEKDGAYGTLATVAIEGLNNLNVVTCDRMVNRITSKHPEKGWEADPRLRSAGGAALPSSAGAAPLALNDIGDRCPSPSGLG